MKNIIISALTAATVFGISCNAQAISINDISITYWNGSQSATVFATSYSGPYAVQGGGNLPASINDFGDTFNYIAKDDSSNSSGTGTYQDINFTIDANNFSTNGTWNLNWNTSISGALPAYIDLLIGIKAGPQYALYFFDDLFLAQPNNNSATGTYIIGYQHQANQNSNPSTNALSGIAIYGAPGEGNIISPVPEPTTMLLFGTGLIGLAGLARRKNS